MRYRQSSFCPRVTTVGCFEFVVFSFGGGDEVVANNSKTIIYNYYYINKQYPFLTNRRIDSSVTASVAWQKYIYNDCNGIDVNPVSDVFQNGAAAETTRTTTVSVVRNHVEGVTSASSTWKGICCTSVGSRTSFAAPYASRSIAEEMCSRDTWFCSTTSVRLISFRIMGQTLLKTPDHRCQFSTIMWTTSYSHPSPITSHFH